MAVNIVEQIDDRVAIRHVLVSVSDKSGLEQLIPGLVGVNPEIRFFSTGGTYARIAEILGDAAGKHLTKVSVWISMCGPVVRYAATQIWSISAN